MEGKGTGPGDNSSKEEDKANDIEEPNLPENLRSILSDPDIPQHAKKEIEEALVSIEVKKASSFSGPVPPPEILKGYNKTIKNGAERLMKMTEKQSEHRIQLEDHAIKNEIKQSGRGQVFGFILGGVGLILATLLAMYDHETVAGIFGTTTIVGLVAVFVTGKKSQESDLNDKKKEN